MKYLAAVLLLAASVASNLGAYAVGSLDCNTSGASPLTSDAIASVDSWHNDNSECCQTSSTPCVTILTHGTASVNLCGRQGFCTDKPTVASVVGQLALICAQGSPEKSGGRVILQNGLSVELFHS
ncbi:hypothetical protein DFP72DRAFT_454132 [Ephemerocybe angulata]|uniref:Uncharacterized protein n=1 Tax=Ephemerocybe angulata TaxID=980116 RepID=A0A8H6HSP6_9AGAR|nr:hypothetical protein DFP72DRAFT_454132 [Tulosesus angulatus]